MGNLFVIRPGGDGDAEQERREAECRRIRERYVRHLVDTLRIDEGVAVRVIGALFDHVDRDGKRCPCSCHPMLSDQHDDGFDCSCSWDEQRRLEQRRRWQEWWDSPGSRALAEHHAREEEAIDEWLAGQPGVEARRTTSYAPEQWNGTIDGHSFYFRERHGDWRIELDLQESGRFAERLLSVSDGGEMITEPVPVMEGEIVAEGVESQLGGTPVDHIAFIVQTVRQHLWQLECQHSGAVFYCPLCGRRVGSTVQS